MKLEKCPFCASGADDRVNLVGFGLVNRRFRVECECGAHGPMMFTAKEAIDAWNRRDDRT